VSHLLVSSTDIIVKSVPVITVETMTRVTRLTNLPSTFHERLWVEAESGSGLGWIPRERRERNTPILVQ
jgi:hypothetical protein